MPQRVIVRDFAGLPSVNAQRSGAGGHPCHDRYLAEYLASRGIAEWIGARW